MAFSTQKDFFHVPFMNESVDFECKKACVKLKSYESTIDDRAWSLDEVKQSKFLSDLVTCNLPVAAGGDGEGGSTEQSRSRADSRGRRVRGSRGSCSTSGPRVADRGDSLIQMATEDIDRLERMLDEKKYLEKQLEISNERRKCADEECDKLKELMDKKFDRSASKDLRKVYNNLKSAGKLCCQDDKDLSAALKAMDDMTKSYDALRSENGYLRILLEKLNKYASMDNITLEPEKSTDLCYLQSEINKLRKEVEVLQRMGDENMRETQERLSADEDTLRRIAKERDALRKKLASFHELESQIQELQEKAKHADQVSSELSCNLEHQRKYIWDLEIQMKSMQCFYEDQLKYQEELLKRQLKECKDELRQARCEAEQAENLQIDIAHLRNQLAERNIALNEYDCQYRELVCVVEGLQQNASQSIAESETQTCDEAIDELAYYTSATVCEILNELNKRIEITSITAGMYGRIDTSSFRTEPIGPLIDREQAEKKGKHDVACACDLTEWKNTIDRLEEEKANVERKLKECHKCSEQCENSLKRLMELEGDNKRIKIEAEKAWEDNQRLTRELSENVDRLSEMEQRLSKLDEDVAENERETADFSKELEQSISLVKEITDVQRSNEKLSEAVTAIQSEDEKKIIDNLKKQLEDASNQNKQCLADKELLNKQLRDALKKLYPEQYDRETLADIHPEVIDRASVADIKEPEKEPKQLPPETMDRASVVDIKDPHTAELEKELKRLQPEKAERESVADIEDPRIAEIQRELKRLHPDKTDRESLVDIKDPKIAELERELKQLHPDKTDRDTVADIQDPKVAELERELKRLQPDKKDRDTVADIEDPKVAELERKLKRLQPDKKDRDTVADIEDPKIAELERKLKRLQPDKRDRDTLADIEDPKVAELERELKRLRPDKKDTDTAADIEDPKIAELESELKKKPVLTDRDTLADIKDPHMEEMERELKKLRPEKRDRDTFADITDPRVQEKEQAAADKERQIADKEGAKAAKERSVVEKERAATDEESKGETARIADKEKDVIKGAKVEEKAQTTDEKKRTTSERKVRISEDKKTTEGGKEVTKEKRRAADEKKATSPGKTTPRGSRDRPSVEGKPRPSKEKARTGAASPPKKSPTVEKKITSDEKPGPDDEKVRTGERKTPTGAGKKRTAEEKRGDSEGRPTVTDKKDRVSEETPRSTEEKRGDADERAVTGEDKVRRRSKTPTSEKRRETIEKIPPSGASRPTTAKVPPAAAPRDGKAPGGKSPSTVERAPTADEKERGPHERKRTGDEKPRVAERESSVVDTEGKRRTRDSKKPDTVERAGVVVERKRPTSEEGRARTPVSRRSSPDRGRPVTKETDSGRSRARTTEDKIRTPVDRARGDKSKEKATTSSDRGRTLAEKTGLEKRERPTTDEDTGAQKGRRRKDLRGEISRETEDTVGDASYSGYDKSRRHGESRGRRRTGHSDIDSGIRDDIERGTSSRHPRIDTDRDTGRGFQAAPQDEVAYMSFLQKRATGMAGNLEAGLSLETELRATLDAFIIECGFCFCKDFQPRSKFYALCHKILHYGIHSLSFRELICMHRRIYVAAEKERPGWLFNILLNEYNAAENIQLKCCTCKNNLCCNNSEEMLKDKVSKLEHDIEVAREYLDKLIKLSQTTPPELNDYDDFERSYCETSGLTLTPNSIQNLKARIC